MRAKGLILDFADYDLDCVVADREKIREINPQRHEMEQLTAIVYDDPVAGVVVGYKDITDDEFWVRGHMPGVPLMPGVMICEAAAQLCSYFTQKHGLLDTEMIGFGGMEDVRFRDVVRPGSRLVIVAEELKCRPRAMIVSRFQAFVNQALVAEGKIKGIPLPVDAMRASS